MAKMKSGKMRGSSSKNPCMNGPGSHTPSYAKTTGGAVAGASLDKGKGRLRGNGRMGN